MIKHINVFKKRLSNSFFYIVLFSFIFSFVGWFIPRTYFEYFDRTKYYKIYSPVLLDKEKYKSCEIVSVYIRRESIIEVKGDVLIELILIQKNNSIDKRTKIIRETNIDKGEKLVVIHLPLPCDNVKGEYYFLGSVTYEINHVNKVEHFNTVKFQIYE